jgi:hypothetical protein
VSNAYLHDRSTFRSVATLFGSRIRGRIATAR